MVKIISTLDLDQLLDLKNKAIELKNNCFNNEIYKSDEYFVFEYYFDRKNSSSLIGDVLWHFLQSTKTLHLYIIDQKEYDKKYDFFNEVAITKNLGIFNKNVEIGDERVLKIENRKYNNTEDILKLLKEFKTHNFKNEKIYHCVFK